MKDADFVPNNSSLKPKNESNRRGRVGKPSSPPQAGGTRGGKQKGGAGGPDRWNMKIPAYRARNNNRQLSIISAASATLPGQDAGPWCDKCTSLNRQLHGYLLEILKDGEDAVGKWAYAVGASPDQMDCEPAPERIIPEGFRRCSRQHQLCGVRTEGDAGTALSPIPSRWPVTTSPSAVYSGQPVTAPVPASAGAGPCSQLGSRSDLAQRMQETNSAPAGGALQNRQSLFAIPEHADSFAQRTGPPSQAQLPAPQPLQPPWNGASQRPVAMYPSCGPLQNTTYHWAYQQRNVPNAPPEHNNPQNMGTMHRPPGSMAYNEVVSGIGQGRVVQEVQSSSDSDVPK
ncbi:hypothetical protein INS49_015249 [Diaporthe citri]|uniref:uncharacterized protein n=1 Tax=Diaporthe citri TaxID=83186 RepID=UPI001C81CB6A|nr:uncharacterized protein INS49_015249 [Diaporthe citri]KAG6355865.1 hypothetical protein INS49_015249 [Diaporthe citri]